VFAKAFGKHNKARWATTKIRSLLQGMYSVSVNALDFKQLVYNINLDEKTLVNQFHWDLKDNVKNLLLSLPDLQTLNEAIS